MILEILFSTLLLANLAASILALSAVGNLYTAMTASAEEAIRHTRFQSNVTRSVITDNHERLRAHFKVPPTQQELLLDEFGRLERGEPSTINAGFGQIGPRR
jgi:hypothetical protein